MVEYRAGLTAITFNFLLHVLVRVLAEVCLVFTAVNTEEVISELVLGNRLNELNSLSAIITDYLAMTFIYTAWLAVNNGFFILVLTEVLLVSIVADGTQSVLAKGVGVEGPRFSCVGVALFTTKLTVNGKQTVARGTDYLIFVLTALLVVLTAIFAHTLVVILVTDTGLVAPIFISADAAEVIKVKAVARVAVSCNGHILVVTVGGVDSIAHCATVCILVIAVRYSVKPLLAAHSAGLAGIADASVFGTGRLGALDLKLGV